MVGTEGSMEVGQRSVKLRRTQLGMVPGGYSMVAQTEANQEALKAQYASQEADSRAETLGLGETVWEAPRDYKGGHYDHFFNFFDAIRGNRKVVQNATFGLRAAGAALLANESYYRNQPVGWDPEKMRLL